MKKNSIRIILASVLLIGGFSGYAAEGSEKTADPIVKVADNGSWKNYTDPYEVSSQYADHIQKLSSNEYTIKRFDSNHMSVNFSTVGIEAEMTKIEGENGYTGFILFKSKSEKKDWYLFFTKPDGICRLTIHKDSKTTALINSEKFSAFKTGLNVANKILIQTLKNGDVEIGINGEKIYTIKNPEIQPGFIRTYVDYNNDQINQTAKYKILNVQVKE